MGRIPLSLFCGAMLACLLTAQAGGDELASEVGRRSGAQPGARPQSPPPSSPQRVMLEEPTAPGGLQLPAPDAGGPGVDPFGGSRPGWSGFLGSFEPYVRGLIERARPALYRREVPRPTQLPGGPGLPGGDVSLAPPGTQAGAAAALPTRFAFGPLSPNPSAGRVTFRFDLPTPALVRITVVDVAGRVVHEYRAPREAGRHTHEWNGWDRSGRVGPSGVYFALLEANGRTIGSKRLVILQ